MVGATKNPIPVIDMQDSTAEQRQKLIEACEEWGFFRIVNYEGILPEKLMKEMKEVMRPLVDLPVELKMKNVDVIPGTGYLPPSKFLPLYESLGIYDVASPQAVEAFCSNLEATPHQRETLLKYGKAVNELMMDIVSKIGQGLGVKNVSTEDWPCTLRINKYSFTPEAVNTPGVQLHTDSSFLTILQDDEIIGGLEVMKRSGEFHIVDPCPGQLLVNIGDIAVPWSNGRFLNVKHRVICKEAGIRLSFASFLLGPKEALVESPPELVDEEHPRLFRPFNCNDFRNLRASKKLRDGDEALEFYALKCPSN